jgi:hypothetical protein
MMDPPNPPLLLSESLEILLKTLLELLPTVLTPTMIAHLGPITHVRQELLPSPLFPLPPLLPSELLPSERLVTLLSGLTPNKRCQLVSSVPEVLNTFTVRFFRFL